MSLYPDLPGARSRALAHDVLVLLVLLGLAWFGLRVYHDVNGLSSLGAGVSQAGSSVRSGFSSAASAANSIPLAGGAIAGALRDAARATGGNVAAIGQQGERSAHHVAVVLGLLTWAIPSLLLLMLVLPRRVRQVRRLRAARLALRGPDAEQRKRLLAVRAVLTLPDQTLFEHTGDPAGDLLAGRYDALAAAELEADGVKAKSSP